MLPEVLRALDRNVVCPGHMGVFPRGSWGFFYQLAILLCGAWGFITDQELPSFRETGPGLVLLAHFLWLPSYSCVLGQGSAGFV